jgi:hypothetical protein
MTLLTRIQSAATAITDSLTQCVTRQSPARHRTAPSYVAPPPRSVPDFIRAYDGPPDRQATRAADLCNSERMVRALKAGANINCLDTRGQSLLMRTLTASESNDRYHDYSRNRYQMVSTLMSSRDKSGNHIDVLHANEAGSNAVHLAAASRQPYVLVRALLMPLLQQANGYTLDDLERALDTRDAAGRTPQEIAAASGGPRAADAITRFRDRLEDQRRAGPITWL